MITREESALYFRQLLGSKASWKKLASSQFVNQLSVFASWCLRESLWRLERLYQEFFISTAINRSSILAHVEDREYIPRKRKPASGVISIQNNGKGVMTIPVYTPFISAEEREYLTMKAVSIAARTTVEIPVSQMEISVITYGIPREEAFHSYLLTVAQSEKLSSFTVELDTDGTGFKFWTYARLFQNSGPNDQVYDEFYSHTGQTGIRFGNGVFGKMPPLNAVMRLTIYLTDGETSLLAGQTLSMLAEINDTSGAPATVKAESGTPIDNGGNSETLEEIRANLHYWSIYNEKLIWADDYTFFIRKQIDDIVWTKAWGEEEQEKISGFDVHNINRIFVTAYAPDTPTLADDVMAKFLNVKLLNRRFTWVEPIHSTFSIAVSGRVARTVIASEVITAISEALVTDYGRDSKTRKNEVYTKDFYKLINATSYFGDSNSYFEVTISGKTVPTALEEMISIDMDSTVINLDYA